MITLSTISRLWLHSDLREPSTLFEIAIQLQGALARRIWLLELNSLILQDEVLQQDPVTIAGAARLRRDFYSYVKTLRTSHG